MRIELTPIEARVIGCLLEKETITPEHYPLSLNGLTAACNQKSSRHPVMHLSEEEVQGVLDELIKKHLVSEQSGYGSRVPKYKHRFCNTGFGGFEFSAQEVGLLCMLLLRGCQTPGELRSRTQRLCHFDDVNETERVLKTLMERSDGPFVARLPRESGRRESRYRHLFGDESEAALPEAPEETSATAADDLPRLLREMRIELDELRQRVERLEEQ
ncbi:MAG: DUF480 domain-containing protein [Chromatiales bacterium]|jgi:uncharacterized protein YceH (UPF0502 family)